jgi:putative mRNA 3-end processing factor
MKPHDLLIPRPHGLFCPPGDFYIDPVRPVETAIITHGHADHARPGNSMVVATRQTLDIMAIRYGDGFAANTQAMEYGQAVTRNGVTVSLHPAGHVLGSAQIRVEWKGLRIAVSGDYKRRDDPTCKNFEVVECDVFISEATFGLPVFRHPDDRDQISRLLRSVDQFPERAHLVGAYGLGKAQRVIRLLREAGYERPIYIHGSLQKLCQYYEGEGVGLGLLKPATTSETNRDEFAGAIVIAPPSATGDKWSRRFPDPLPCFASGWMRLRQRARQSGVELPLILSDHADWDELTGTIVDTAAEEVWVTHGSEEALVRWAELNGLKGIPLNIVGYDGEGD